MYNEEEKYDARILNLDKRVEGSIDVYFHFPSIPELEIIFIQK